MSNNHFTKRQDCYLKEAITSFSGCPICWPRVRDEFNKRFRRSQRTVEGLQTRWRTLQKKAKQESLKRIAQKDGFEKWFAKLLACIKELRGQKKIDEAKIAELKKRIEALEKERDNAIREFEDHLAKDEKIRDGAKRLAKAALAVSGD